MVSVDKVLIAFFIPPLSVFTHTGNPRFLNVSTQQNITENTTGFILCPVDRGYREASVGWRKNGHTVSSPRINVTYEGLRIADVKPEDAGNYTCSLCRVGWGCASVTIAVEVLTGTTAGECMQGWRHWYSWCLKILGHPPCVLFEDCFTLIHYEGNVL